MEHPTQLEQFLTERESQGRKDSEGQFTISGKQALEKLAQFQLPFRAAWVLKLVQCAVREQAMASILVELTAREARFQFHVSSFTLAEVEEAFYSLEPIEIVSLRYLVNALRVVGLHEKWPFELSHPQEQQSLVWTGESFQRRPALKKIVKTTLVIALRSERKGWLGGVVGAAELNSDLQSTLSRWCFTCPVPLIVDGRRLDSLQACVGHGWSTTTYPLALGFAKAQVPDFPLSPGTFEKQPSKASWFELEQISGGTLRADGERVMSAISPKQIASIPYLITFHTSSEKRGSYLHWRRDAGESLLYWVQDGVVVQTEPLCPTRTHCSVGCFVNAEGLDSDLTTLHLRDNSLKSERVSRVREALVDSIAELTVWEDALEELAEASRSRGRWSRKAFFLAGFGAFWVSPLAGVLLTGAAFLAGNAPDAQIQNRMELYRSEIQRLLAALRSSTRSSFR